MSQFAVPWREKPEPSHGFVSSFIVALAKGIYAIATPIVTRFPGSILLSAVVASCFLVWAHALLFSYVDTAVLERAAEVGAANPNAFGYFSPSTWGLPPSVIGTLLAGDAAVEGQSPGLLSYLLWPVQFGFTRDMIAFGAIFAWFNIVPVYVIWWERKVAGRIQSRLGPMRVGGWHGWAQSPADGIKLVLKEDFIPDAADSILFRAAPYFAIIPSALAFVALPFGVTYIFREVDVALVFILAMLGIEVMSVILGGWASNNKWSVYGGMREACQMVAYEIPMGMALLVPVVCVGSLSLKYIGEVQADGWFSWLAFRNPFAFVAFVTYFIASLASCKRAPFDLPEAESELVAGFLTEYSGFRWALFFFAEYAAMFVVGGLATIMFLGGWNSPIPSDWGAGLGESIWAKGLKGILFSGPIWFILKCVFFLFLQLWVRWTLPRIRLDQVLYACVQVLLPLTMVLLFGTTLWVWASESGNATWDVIASIVSKVLGIVGLAFGFGFVAIAGYGFYHRRRLVGNLVIDPLPGS